MLDESALPNILYVCKRAANGSYVWSPYCECENSGVEDGPFYNYNVTTIYGENSTVFVSNTSTFIVTGYAYFNNVDVKYLAAAYASLGNVTVNGSLDYCPSSPGAPPLRASSMTSCTNGPVDFPQGVTIAGVPVTPGGSGGSNGTCNCTRIASNGSAVVFPDGVKSYNDFALPVYNSTAAGGYAPLLALVVDGLAHMYWDSGISAPIVCTLQYNTCVPYKRQVITGSTDIQVSSSSSGTNNNVQLFLNSPLPSLTVTNLTVDSTATYNGPLTANGPSVFTGSVTMTTLTLGGGGGLSAAAFQTQSVSVVWYARNSLGLACGASTDASFTVILTKIAVTKFVYYTYTGSRPATVARVTFGAASTCESLVLASASTPTIPYIFPSAYQSTAIATDVTIFGPATATGAIAASDPRYLTTLDVTVFIPGNGVAFTSSTTYAIYAPTFTYV